MKAWSDSAATAAEKEFDQDWRHIERLAIDEDPVNVAGELAARYGLRGYDAVHLASARRATQIAGAVIFASFDIRLLNAAVSEGMITDLRRPESR